MQNNPDQCFDPRALPESFYLDPFATYRALRGNTPVYRCPDGGYFLTRYRDCYEVYRHHRQFSSDKKREFKPKFGDTLLYEHHTTSLVFNDPPLHTWVRKAFGDALSPRSVAALAPAIEQLVDRLLDRIEDAGEVDAIDQFAGVIPVEVIGNMLAIPHSERGPLRRWSLAILGALEPVITPEQLEHGNRCMGEFLAFLEDFVADRRATMTEQDDDMLTRLIRWENGGHQLTNTQLYHQCIFLLNAGHETTTNLIGNGIHALLTHPEELQRLLADPGLIESAVEEILRFESPNQLGNRMAVEDTEIGGTPIAAGTPITLCIGAANRDPEQFPDPEHFDIGRSPNAHLAFGSGIHTCAGLTVARLEGRIALGKLFRRFPKVRLAGEPVRSHRARFRGFTELPLSVS